MFWHASRLPPLRPESGALTAAYTTCWLAADSLAFFISNPINLSAFDARYGTEGPGK
jgi:hypothetical protein